MIRKIIRHVLKGVRGHKNNLNPFYVGEYPTNQNIINIFAGNWSSAMPAEAHCTSIPGSANLFEDPRIHWAEKVLGGFKGANVLELGPLEGHHSYMLHKAGAKSVLAIEANSRSFLKCLCIKEICNLHNVSFLLGDCLEYLKANKQHFDVVFANGLLYHMNDPLEFLELLSKTTDRIVMWTHYYNAKHIHENAKLAKRFDSLKTLHHGNFSYQAAQQYYNESRFLLTTLLPVLRRTGLGWTGFCGGPLPTSTWLTRESILSYLKYMGFTEIHVSFESVDHPNGPSFNLCATRLPSPGSSKTSPILG